MTQAGQGFVQGPLDGVRVIDLSAVVSGPFATAMLADQGADVVVVEPVDAPDIIRSAGVVAKGAEGASSFWVAQNRNKRAIALDLKTERGVQLLKDLVRRADVVVQNFRPAVVQRMGIGWEVLSAMNPGLVMVSISGFGSDGPYANRPAFDPILQSICGYAVVQADPDGRPRLMRTILVDKVTSLNVAQAVCAALVARANGHGGQHVEVAMLDAAIHFLWCDGMWNYTYLDHPSAQPEVNLSLHLYRTTDGWVMVYPIAKPQHWHNALVALGRLDLEDDPRFRELYQRSGNVVELNAELQPSIGRFSTAEVIELMLAHDVPVAPVNDRAQMLADPQVLARQIVVEADHPVAGRVRMARSAPRYSKTPATMRRHAPGHGEHTEEVLNELGLAPAEIAQLRAEGVVR
ncbi:MAG: CaiB/BaiF CoA transferase family protein [Acidimicrobiales bacterium]